MKYNQGGFSMIEILITLVIIATALLGTAGLQLYAMRNVKSADQRTQAVFLVSELIERMEANKAGAVAGAYVTSGVAATSFGGDCMAGSCNSSQIAGYDLDQWTASVASAVPGASWNVSAAASGVLSTYTVRVQWTDRDKQAASGVAGVPFSYTASHILSN